MERIAKVAAILGVIFLVALLSLISFVQLDSQVENSNLRRQVTPRLLLGNNQSGVSFTRLAQPVIACPSARRATNIALLLDKSGSMADNDAMSAAMDAVEQFVQTVDLSTAYVAVIFFDDAPILAQSPTQDDAALQRIFTIPVEPDGGTDIARAMQEAQAALDMATVPVTAVPVIILLTDGGSEPQAASVTAQALKDQGVRIIAISLLTNDSNPDLLRSLAFTPSDYYETLAPADLQKIYTDLAEEINTAVAFNVSITETVKSGLSVLPASLQPAGNLTNNQIVWELPNLSNDETSFNYRVTASHWGLYTLNEKPATMSYTDCITGATTIALTSGPRLLALPPTWLLGLLIMLPFLPLIGMAWFKRSRPTTSSSQPPPPMAVEPEPPPDSYPAWLKRLDNSRKTLAAMEIAMEDSELTPTMLIGIGPVGRMVLSQVGQSLRARYGGRLPDVVRLLQIDVQPKGVAGLNLSCPEYLEPEEWVLLEPDLAEVSRTVQRRPDEWSHLAWYEAAAMEEYGRTRGRMAVFYDLMNGADRSVLWRSLTKTTVKLDHPKLRLIGSTFDDTSSGMLIDVAWLIQMITNSNVDVELWLSGPLNQAWSSRLHNPRQLVQVNVQKDRSLATLRELERFQRNATVPFHYVPDNNLQAQFRKTATAAVVQTLFLFTPPDEKCTVDDHLTTIADGLLAVLHKSTQQALSQHLSRTGARASVLTNKDGMGMICSLGAYSVRMPLGLLEEALIWRMAQELLFEKRIGLLPLRRMLPDGNYEILVADDMPGNAAKRRESAEALIQRYRHRWHTANFFHAVARQVGKQLNGETGETEPPVARAGGIVRAIRWLVAVRNQLNIEGEPHSAQIVNTLRQQLVDWQSFLEESVAPVVQQHWQDARSQLEQLVNQSGRQWALPPGLEWPTYRQRIRNWLDAPQKSATSEPLVRAAERFGWQLVWQESNREWQTQLWLPPGNFIWAGPDSLEGLDSFIVDRDAAAFTRQLYALIAPLARHRASAQYALDGAEKLDVRVWLQKASPRLPINVTEASRIMGVIGGIRELAILVAPQSDRAIRLQESLRHTPGSPTVELCQTDDETAVTLLRIRDRVPLQSFEQGYGAEAWQNQFVPSGLYTWRGEQLAAEIENEKRLSSLFIGWLEQDAQVVDLFARAYLLSLLDAFDRKQLELPGLGRWAGVSVGEGLANLFSRDDSIRPAEFINPERRAKALNQLAQAIAEAQEAIWRNPGKRDYLRKAEDKLVVPLTKSKDIRDQDLAIYLKGIIRQL